jgi:amino acid adenylation domain-containing protein
MTCELLLRMFMRVTKLNLNYKLEVIMENRINSYKLALAAEQKVKEKEYWLNKLSGDLVKTGFPYDYKVQYQNKTQAFSQSGMQVETFRFSQTLFSKAMKLSKGKSVDVKLHMILVTGLFILLNKYTAHTDIVIGSPLLKQEEGVGEFINTVLVFKNNVDASTGFKQLLLQVKETIIGANKNQNYPIEKLLGRLNIPITTNESPLFDVVILLENLYDKRFIQDIHYNMGFSFKRTAESIAGTVEYNSLLYRQGTVRQIIRHYLSLLDQVFADVNVRLSRIQLLSEEERKQILVDFNKAGANYQGDKTLQQLFAYQAEQTPGKVALVGQSARRKDQAEEVPHTQCLLRHAITYKELNEQSDQLALLLREKGVQADTIVGLMIEPSIEMMVCIWGILKANGAYMPIDLQYPGERVNYMLADSGANVLVTTSTLAKEVKMLRSVEVKKNFENILIDSFQFSSCSSSHLLNFSTSRPSSLVYVIYTSGSTGKPKGVLVEHGNVAAYIYAFFREFGIGPGDTGIQLTTYAFDVFVEGVFPFLLKGGKVIIPGYNELVEMEVLYGLMVKHHVNIIDCTPLQLNEINKLVPPDNPFGRTPTIISGGDVLKWENVTHFLRIGKVYNTYGPTETTVCAVYYRLPYEDENNKPGIPLNIPIGKPISNYAIYILDDNHTLVPIGVTGELCVSGDGVTRGYLNRPELTAEKFRRAVNMKTGSTVISPSKKISKSTNDQCLMTNDQFSKVPNDQRLMTNDRSLPPHSTTPPLHHSPHSPIYLTGDLARWLLDGNIEFSGRKDHQVKIRGYRVEAGEIEQRILKMVGIKEAVVVAREDKDGDKYLCAYIVSDKELDISGLRDYLALVLPGYMIPSYFTPLETVPLTSSGKIDKRSLPVPEVSAGITYVGPQNSIQVRLQEIWQKVLAVEPIGINDDFFRIGGHSLRGIHVCNNIHQVFDVKVPLVEIFKNPTIKGLSQYIQEAAQDKFAPIQAAEEKEYYGLSSAQKRLYILEQMEPGSTAYNMSLTIPLDTVVDKGKLEGALLKLIHRHDSLRTSFVIINEQPVQWISPIHGLDFTIDYHEVGKEEVVQIVKNFVKPFDLTRAPLLRVALIRITGEERKYVLMIDLHHIISDGVSTGVLHKDIMAFYQDEAEKLPPLRLQFKDYVQWQNNEKKRENIKKQENYWLKEFEGEIPILDIPTDFPRSAHQNFAGNRVDFTIDKESVNALNTIAAEQGATMYMVFLALYNVLLSKICRQEDIVVGTGTAGRRHADLEMIIGMFVNTLALRNFPKKEMLFINFLKDIKNRTLEAFDNQDYPFEDLVDKVAAHRDMSRNPLFDVMFSLMEANGENPGNPQEIHDGSHTEFLSKNISSKFDMTLIVSKTAGDFYFTFIYCTKLFKEKTIARFTRSFKKLVSCVIENPAQKISEMELIPESEKNEILSDSFVNLEYE